MLPIYIGDDKTDEDAFKVRLSWTFVVGFNSYFLTIQFSVLYWSTISGMLTLYQVLREGKRGFGILVSTAPKESSAFYSLRDPSEVQILLLVEKLINLSVFDSFPCESLAQKYTKIHFFLILVFIKRVFCYSYRWLQKDHL